MHAWDFFSILSIVVYDPLFTVYGECAACTYTGTFFLLKNIKYMVGNYKQDFIS